MEKARLRLLQVRAITDEIQHDRDQFSTPGTVWVDAVNLQILRKAIMASTHPRQVAIIGAGLAGTALALSLHHHLPGPLSVSIYESRRPDAPELSSGVVLTPNGLHILKALGVYDQIKDICWQSQYRTYKNEQDVTTRKSLIAPEELYGFCNHRLYRRILLAELKRAVSAIGVEIKYETKFEGIVKDDNESVVFKINGQEQTADLLVGADGIYSSVRKYLWPDVEPEYTGTTGVLGHIRWDAVDWPYDDYERAFTLQGTPGAFFVILELKDGSEIMVGMQAKWADMSRAEWDALARDKEKLSEWYRRDYDRWGTTARKVLDAVTAEDETPGARLGKQSLYLWKFLKMPKMDRWYSTSGRVLIVGDAAHAIPPSSAQGVNQALEDIWALGRLLAATSRERIAALEFWQTVRQERVDAVYAWATGTTNVMRMGKEERDRLIAEGKIEDPDKMGGKDGVGFDDMAWLYRCDTDARIDRWVESGRSNGCV